MADFGSFKITNDGLDLEYKAQVGETLNFTKFVLGDGNYTGSIRSLTDLVNPIMEAEITRINVQNISTTKKVTIGFNIDTSEITTGFYLREIGLFAEDPDTGDDVLVFYGNAGETADYISSSSSTTVSEKLIDLEVYIDDVDTITAVIDSSMAYVTTSQFNSTVNTINASLGNKVDKALKTGSTTVYKVLSDNNYSDDEKTKLTNIETGATRVIVDNSLSSSSENAIQNKVVENAISTINTTLGDKVDKVTGKGLSKNDYSDEEKAKVAHNYEVVTSELDANAIVEGEGSEVTLENCANAVVGDVVIKGDTEQGENPTPENPQDVHVVTGNVNLKKCNKNLIGPLTDFEKNNNPLNVTYNDDSIIVTHTATNAWVGLYKTYDNLPPNVNMTLSAYAITSTSTGYGLTVRDSNGVVIQEAIRQQSGTKTIINFVVPNDGIVTIRLYSGYGDVNIGDTATYSQIQLEKGNTSTQYVQSQGQTYPINLGTTELCKIGDNQDYIYNSGNKWYKHKAIAKIASYNAETINTSYISTTGSLTTGATVYYVLATPIEEEITNTTLLSQLNAIKQSMKTYEGTTNIIMTGADLAPIIDVKAYTDTFNGKINGNNAEIRRLEEQKTIVNQFSIPTTSWSYNSTKGLYEATLTNNNITTLSSTSCDFDEATYEIAKKAGIQPFTTEFDGSVKLYSDNVPTGAVSGKCTINRGGTNG